jgi:dTMP kinase
MSAKLIEFDGGDGSGKTTAYNRFCDQLEAKGFKVLRTHEIGNPHLQFAVEVRKILLDPKNDLDGRSMELMFAAMRIENHRLYDKVKDSYDFIVSDRGWLSHPSYGEHNAPADFALALWYGLLFDEAHMPQTIYLFDVAPEVALARRVRRGTEPDAIEIKGVEFQRKVLASYLQHAAALQQRSLSKVVIVNANLPKEDVQKIMDMEVELVASRARG